MWIDVEGFDSVYRSNEAKALSHLAKLADAIHAIGDKAFSGEKERLFAYGLGDGFLVQPDWDRPEGERSIAVAVALMCHMISKGCAVKAAISAGEIADITGCFSAAANSGAMGTGLLKIFPVMGTALTSAYKLSTTVHGAVLALDAAIFSAVPKGVRVTSSAPLLVDWVHSRWPAVTRLSETAELKLPEPRQAEQFLRAYVEANDLTPRWIESSLKSNAVALGAA
ncbi:MAG: hypothetical protein GY769_10935 [bacterium]|nr:hypothetical protein [bacterium]